MKKTLLTLAFMLTTMLASAQFYVGGGIGYSTAEVGDVESTAFSITPEVGYVIDNNWSVGAVLGFEDQENVGKTFAIEPYVRYTFLKAGGFSLFADGAVAFGTVKPEDGDNSTIWSVGIKPGVSYKINNNFSVCAHVGWLGHTDLDEAGEATSIKMSGNNLEFSVYYNF